MTSLLRGTNLPSNATAPSAGRIGVHRVVPTVCAILSVCCYAYFSREYEPLTRRAPDPLVAAVLLYGLAALLLAGGVALAAVTVGTAVSIPSAAVAFGIPLRDRGGVLACLTVLIALMSILYGIHIDTEARARRSVNMGVYAVLFQLHLLVIAFLDGVVYRKPVTWPMAVGGLAVFASGTGILWGHLRPRESQGEAGLFDRRAAVLSLLSAVACGLALMIDGEVGRQFLFHRGVRPSDAPGFLFYEALTFGLPSILCFAVLTARRGLRSVRADLTRTFRADRGMYVRSSALSALHFVFAVFALSLPGPRFTVAMVLSLAPLLTVFLDRNPRSSGLVKLEFGLAALAAFGLSLLLTAPILEH